MVFDKGFLECMLARATESSRLRVNHDLRNSATDTSQRMLNAMAVGTNVPIHRHEDTAETVICLCGRLEEIIYERDGEAFKEVSRHLLCSNEGVYGMQIPMGVWHTINILEPSVIFEAKDGMYRR